MRVTIYQPRYFPQLHYFNRIFSSDIFVILDTAQYTKSLTYPGEKKTRIRSYQSDTPIKTAAGIHLLTVPLRNNGLLPIAETEIAYAEPWNLRHLATIRSAYNRAPYYKTLSSRLEMLLRKKYRTLGQLNIATIIWAIDSLLNLRLPDLTLENLNISLQKQRQVRLRQVLTVGQTGVSRPNGYRKGTEWTAAICTNLSATEYLHGGTGREAYMDLQYYNNLGVRPIEQNWTCSTYLQQFTENHGFTPNLSVLDLLFNVDHEAAQKILTHT